MARQMKEGHFWSGKLSASSYQALTQYAELTGLSKTYVVEQALLEYVKTHGEQKECEQDD